MKAEVIKRMRHWLDLLVEKIDTTKVMSIVMPGNDDPLELDEAIKEYADRNIHYPTDKVLDLEGHELISHEYVTPTPWDTPRETDEEGMRTMLEEKVSWLKGDVHNSIWNIHCPPKDTDIDLAPQLNKDLKVQSGAGGVDMVHVGSRSPYATSSRSTSRCWVCTATSTSRAASRSSATPSASTPARSTARACCAGSSSS